MVNTKFKVFVGLLVLVSLVLIFFSNFSPFSIQLERDSIYIDVAEKSFTDIIVDQEIYPYDDVHIIVNSIIGSTVTNRGPSPYSYYVVPSDGVTPPYGIGACSGLTGWSVTSLNSCCQKLGYTGYRSDTGWNICYSDVSIVPDDITMVVGGKTVYNWDGEGTYPIESDNFADIINSACGLDQPLIICEDSKYLYSQEYSSCVYYQLIEDYGSECVDKDATNLGHYGQDYIICSMSAVERTGTDECKIRVDVDSSNGYGYLSLGLYVGNTQSAGDITLVQPPLISDSPSTDSGTDTDTPADEDEIKEGVSVEGFTEYVQGNLLFVSLVVLLTMLIIGGLAYGWKRRR